MTIEKTTPKAAHEPTIEAVAKMLKLSERLEKVERRLAKMEKAK